MSYILEALRKSERQREQGTVPLLHTAHHPAPEHRRLWLGASIGALVLISAAAAAWLLGPGLPYGAVDNPGSAAASPDAGGRAPETAVDASRAVGGERRQPGAAAATGGEPTMRQDGGIEPATASGDLGAGLRQRIRDLSVNVVSYSEAPERRFVMLNQRIVRESETVADGVVVQRIEPGGVYLSVEGEEVFLRPR